MTGRDALDWLKRQNKKQNDGNGDLWLEMYISVIERDLEALEILRKYYYRSDGNKIEFWAMPEAQLKKVKECLENER